MRKRLTAIISLIVSIFLTLSFFMGCNLVTTDSEKDMGQVVATVSIADGLNDEIYKSDLIINYLNGGYQYEQSYGYTRKDSFELILNNLISQRIVLQTAMVKYENGGVKDESAQKYTATRYLTAEEITDAKYAVYSSINALIESYKEETGEEVQDSLVGEVRTVPTGATKKEADIDKAKYLTDNEDFKLADKKAVAKVANMLKTNGLLGASYEASGNLEDSVYFKQLLDTQYENEVVNNYQEDLASEARKTITYQALSEKYAEMYATQTSWDNADFASKISSATATEPIVYSAYGTYGFVYNLLLGVSADQTTEITKIKEDNKNISDEDYAVKRKAILDKTIIKDLRSSWVLSGYDASLSGETLTFTGDYTLVNDGANSLPYQGKVTELVPANPEKNENAKYAITSSDSFTVSSFVTMMEAYLGGTATTSTADYTALGSSIYGTAKDIAGVTEYKNKVNELLFAFSTDSGSLNTYKGYVIKPAVDGSNSEEYVKTFGDAGRKLLANGKDGYVIVASDYGYHVMFFSAIANMNYPTLDAYLDSLATLGDIDKGTFTTWTDYYNNMIATGNYADFDDTDSFLYTFSSAQITTAVTKIQEDTITELQNKYLYSGSYVTKYTKAYEDLLEG